MKSQKLNVNPLLKKPLVICGPSGVGKGTMISLLMKKEKNKFGFSISHTTRKPRGKEKNGIEYHFVSEKEFKNGIEKNHFIEHAYVHRRYYGTSVHSINKVFSEGKICILDIDVQGAEQVHKNKEFNPCFVFILPPSIKELENRLRIRNTDSEEQIKERLKNAMKYESKFYEENKNMFDYTILNDKLEDSFAEFYKCIKKHYEL